MNRRICELTFLLLIAPLPVSTGHAQQLLDESCTVTIGGQTIQVNADGSFTISNITAADANADFISDNPVRLVGTCLRDGETTYVVSGCFQFTGGQNFSLSDADLTVLTEPPLDIASIVATFSLSTLTIAGQTIPVDVLATLADGSTAVPDPVIDCMSFRSSNPAIATVDETGLVTAKGIGTALITVQAQAATSVAAIGISLGDPLTTVAGIVEDESGVPVANATVTLEGLVGSDVTDADGAFVIAGVATLNGDIVAKTSSFVGGITLVGATDPVPPLAGAITDVGVIVVSNRIPWVSSSGGSWHIASNWFGGFIPGTGNVAVIDVPGEITVTYSTGTSNLAAIECAETLSQSSGTLSIDEPSFIHNLSLTNGTITGAGDLSIDGSLTWSGATMSGSGTTTMEPEATWSCTGPLNPVLSRPFVSHGVGTLTISMTMFNGTLTNAADGVLNVSGNGGFGVIGANSLINQGLMTLTGTINKSFSAPLTNSGILDVQQGTLTLSGTGTSSGLVTIAPSTTVFLSSSFTFDAASEIASSGTVNMNGGLINFQGDYSSPITILGGSATATFNTGQTVIFPTLTLNGGTLNGADNFSVTGSITTWSATMSGTGTTTIEPGATWNATGPLNPVLSRPLVNHGTGTLTISMTLLNGTLTNASDGVLNVSGSGGFGVIGTNSVVNNGLVNLTGAGTSSFNAPLTNSGTLSIGTGRTLNVNGTFTNNPSGIINGTGTLGVSGISFTQSGALSPGTSAGNLTVTGNLPETSTAAINIEIGGLTQGTEYDKLTVSGVATLDGTLNLSLINGFQPQLGQTFTIMTYSSFTGAFDAINGTDLGNGLQFDVQEGAQSIVLEVIASGG